MRPGINTIFAILLSQILASASLAADKVSTLPRKKLSLHTLGIKFQTSEMTTEKRIKNLSYQNPGILLGDVVTYRASFDPSLALPNERFSWSGAGTGPFVAVQGTQVGNGSITVSVLDKHINANRTRTPTVRVRTVGQESEEDICVTINPITLAACSAGFADADSARDWAASAATRQALGGATDTDNGKSNAAKHAYWNVLMTRDLGASVAERLATAHELLSINGGGVAAGGPHNTSVMDLDNNDRGRVIAGTISFQTGPAGADDPQGQSAVIAADNGGSLTILDDIGNTDRGGLLKPSDK